jgi:multicomponent Na+:H+ antiporter subunit D
VILLPALPLLIPLAGAAASLVAWRHPALQRWLGVAGTAAMLAAGLALLGIVARDGIQVVQVGDWPAPFGIILVADLMAVVLIVLTGFMGLAIAVYSLAGVDRRREAFGYYPLYQLLLAGVAGAFLTGDIFNLYVWFEVMLMASFVLVALGNERAQLEGAIKYVTLNLFGSALFLAAVGLVYGMAGTLNMADLARRLPVETSPGLVTATAVLFLVAFGIKAAVFPLFFWLPASYHTPPPAVSAIFAALLTKVGVYALIRVFTLLFVHDVGYTHTLILALAAVTMLTGVLGAVAQNEFRRILAFHSVSQMGYMVMGLGLFTPLGLAGALYFMLHHGVVKANLFLVSGVAYRLRGSYQLKELGGLYRDHPATAAAFLVTAMSLAGVPPLSGFIGKLVLVWAGLERGEYAVVAVALAVGLLTLLSMTKIWAEAFWKPAPAAAAKPVGADVARKPPGGVAGLLVPVLVLAAVAVILGVAAGPVLALLVRAGEELLDPAAYVAAVLR